jgi:hypothetical protein
VNPSTGEIVDAHKALYVGPATNVTDFVTAVAAMTPENPKNWGGRADRARCLEHPDAEVIKTTIWTCAECGEVLDQKVETLRPNPQDAEILEPTGTDGRPHPQPKTPRGRPLSSGSGTSSHKTTLHNLDTSGSVVADAWMHAAPLEHMPSEQRWE